MKKSNQNLDMVLTMKASRLYELARFRHGYHETKLCEGNQQRLT